MNWYSEEVVVANSLGRIQSSEWMWGSKLLKSHLETMLDVFVVCNDLVIYYLSIYIYIIIDKCRDYHDFKYHSSLCLYCFGFHYAILVLPSPEVLHVAIIMVVIIYTNWWGVESPWLYQSCHRINKPPVYCRGHRNPSIHNPSAASTKSSFLNPSNS